MSRMKRYRQHWRWKFALGSFLVIGSAIGEAVLQTFAFSFNCAFAQITPDSTLPNNSSVTTQNNISTIEGGTQAGRNLFHSFQQFSVPTGGTAIFNNTANIQNIISRVTGGSASNIDGIIRANGTANLFLINPNGIIFGQNAQLNIGGSFVATTANALQFGNQGFFSATNKNIPSPLLTINPSALVFNQINQNAAIQNNSVAFAGQDTAGFDAFGLRVPDGKSLLLVGGNVSMDGGELNASGGRVELGGLAEPGSVALGVDGDNLSLKFPENVARTSVSLTNLAAIYVEGAGGGNIAVNARNLEILEGTVLSAGIGEGLKTSETVAGDITLNATGEIKVAGGSDVRNLVGLGSKGNGGNITIDSGSFSLQDGAQVQALTSGQGNAGNINLNVTGKVDIAGEKNGFFSAIFSFVQTGTLGNGGNITIDSGSFSLRDSAQLSASTSGQGNAGNVIVRARDAASLADNASIFSTVEAGGVGKGGNIDINAATLSLIDGAQLQTVTKSASATQPAGRGDAGNVNVNVTGKVDIAGEKNGFLSGIRSLVETGTLGNGGNITIDSGSFSLQDSAQLTASTLGQGNAGNINVNVTGAINIAGEKNGFVSTIFSTVGTGTVGNGGNITIDSGSFALRDGAQLAASTLGQGNAGNVIVRALDAVSLADNASILSTVDSGGVGKGGNIDINAATLSLIDGAQLQTVTKSASATQPAGRGDAGNVNVNVTGKVHIAGEKNGFASGILSFVQTGTLGNGGNITIDSGSFSLSDGAQLAASTLGQGNAGNVIVRALDAVSLADNASILSTVDSGGVGKGGNIDINAATLSLIDGAQLQTVTKSASATQPAGRGDAGNVNVNVTGKVDIAGEKNGLISGILSFVDIGTLGNGGNITIDSGDFSLRDGAQLEASTSGQGNAGNVTVRALDAVSLADNASIFSTLEAGGVGKGGNIDINAATLSLIDGAQLQTVTKSAFATQPAGRGDAGNINVNVTGKVDIAGEKNGLISGILSFVQTGTLGNGGNIAINSGSFSLSDGAQLSASTLGQGNAGNVNVNVTGAINIAGEKNGFVSTIFSTVGTGTVGNGGNITIDSGSFSLRDGAQLEASTSGQGNAGNVIVRVLDAVSLADNASILSTVDSGGVGKGGNIDINAATLSLIDGAQLATSTRGASATQPAGRGDAGNINVNVTGAVNIAGEKNGFASGILSSVKTRTVGNGGNITIDSGSFSLRDGALLEGSTFGEGNAGTIKVNAADFFTISGKSANFTSGLFVNSESTTGTAGDILVTSPRVTLDNGGRLNAQSASGNGGDINLQTDLLLLRRGAQISTTAGTAQAGGNGGNITIKAPSGFIVAVPSENSDITANAYTGNGGRVDIQAFGIYGIQPRQFPTLFSDITASSKFGINGTVELNTPDIDPNGGLVNLPTVPVDTQVAQTCTAGSAVTKSSFTITGRGGLPPNPGEALNADAVQVDLVGSNREVGKPSTPAVSTNSIKPTPTPIVEATGWAIAANGDIILTSSAPTLTPHSSWQNPADCRVFNQRQGG
ncbi:MAG: filamentous hemagglutinin N-terminal domain-containing protein [Nostoc sp.]|uniref:two-partner secretion domain-containing protein n=1 Tax=Nostoc sp. TaxID=1180 RepID=UPI002FF7521C